MGDCNSQMLPKICSDEIYKLTFEVDCACDCDNLCHCNDKEDESSTTVTRVAVDDKGTVRGFEKSWSTVNGNTTYHTTYTHYSNDQEMLKKLMENFDVKYIG